MDGMDVEHISIDDLVEQSRAKDLRFFAESILQLDNLAPAMNCNQLAARIREVWRKDTIFTRNKDPKYPATSDSKGNGRGQVFDHFWEPTQETRKCIRINIQKLDPKVYPGGDEDVPVAVNGKAMRIPRGKPVIVPVEFVEVLENAEKFIYPEYDPENDPLGGLKEPQIVKEYPFGYV